MNKTTTARQALNMQGLQTKSGIFATEFYDIIRTALKTQEKLENGYVLVPVGFLEKWVEYSCLREDAQDDTYPELREQTEAMITQAQENEE